MLASQTGEDPYTPAAPAEIFPFFAFSAIRWLVHRLYDSVSVSLYFRRRERRENLAAGDISGRSIPSTDLQHALPGTGKRGKTSDDVSRRSRLNSVSAFYELRSRRNVSLPLRTNLTIQTREKVERTHEQHADNACVRVACR